MPTGLTAGFVRISDSANGEVASSVASLEDGTLRSFSSSTAGAFTSRAFSASEFFDGLHFTITDGAASTLLPVHFHLDGSEAGPGGFGIHLDLNLAGGSFAYSAGSNPPGFFHTAPVGFSSFSFTGESVSGFDFDGILNIVPNAPGGVFNTSTIIALGTDCNSGEACDFTHTGVPSWTLPDNLTYTSDSGVFLTAGVATSVSEPNSLSLLACGLLVPGATLARRRRSASR